MWLSWLRTQQSVHEDAGAIPGPAQWAKDPTLLQAVLRSQMQLGSSVAMVQTRAIALSRPLAWELTYATDMAIKRKKIIQVKLLFIFEFTSVLFPNSYITQSWR